MDPLSYLFLVTACILAVTLVLVILSKKRNNKVQIRKVQKEFETRLEECQEKTNRQVLEAKIKLEELQKVYNDNLGKATSRIKSLEDEITKILGMGADEATQKYLAEAKDLVHKVEELEEALAKARADTENATLQAAQIEKLGKKLKELEESLEEAEDEVEDAKKDKKKLQTAYTELQNELDVAEKNGKRYLHEFNEAKKRLDNLQMEFDLKVEVLDFVTEVLTAKLTNDESVISLYQHVDSTVDFISGEVRNVLKQNNLLTDEIEDEFFGAELKAWETTRKKTWIQGKVTIAFVGEFSAGKTSIVNRILSQDDPDVPRLPVSTKATTAIPTYISGGVSTFYQFVTPDNELKSISESTFKRVSKEVLGQVKGVSSLIKYFVMTYKNPYLEKMSILDTPGFSSNDDEDKERTIGVINECDALFWVFDVNSGVVNRSSLKIIKEHLAKPLYIVINQIDTKSTADVDAVENLIRKTLNEEEVKFKDIIRFSQKEPLEIIMNAIKSVSHDNNREFLLDRLIEYVSEKAKNARKETKSALKRSHSCETKHENLIQQFQKELDSLISDCTEVAEIPEFNSRWFSADDYRISQEQYETFGILLNRIAQGRTGCLVNLFNKQNDVVEELTSAWEEYGEKLKVQQSIQDCKEKLVKRSRLFSDHYKK